MNEQVKSELASADPAAGVEGAGLHEIVQRLIV